MHLKALSLGGILFVSLFTGIPASGQLPPMRSTIYPASFSGHVQFPARTYITQAPMTVEAWVYREDETRCETILSQGYTQSFWLGFCANTLRFYRSGSAADAGVNVPERRWTHVAASYSAGEVRFYMDGELVATRALAGEGSGTARPLYVGSDPGGYRFQGALDEVRLWSVARSGDEIEESRFQEIHSGEGLVAAFPTGGGTEAVSGETASLPGGVRTQVTGILPRDLVVPRTPRAILRNGSPNLEEFEGAEKMVVRYVDGAEEFDAVASLVLAKDGAGSATNLWIGITFPELRTGFGFNGGMVRAYFDRDGSGDNAAGSQDVRFTYSAFADSPAKAGYRGAGGGGYVEESALISSAGFQATSGFCAGEFAPKCIEMSVYESWTRSSADGGEIRFMLDFFKAGFGIIIPPVFRPAPFDANPGSPSTWPRLRFGGYANVPASEVSVRAFVYERLPDGEEEPLGGVTVRVVDNRNLSELGRETTWWTGGDASFWLTIPDTVPLRMEVDVPEGWVPVAQRIGGSWGIAPSRVEDWYAIYPTCGEDLCRYTDVFFVYERPPGAVDFGEPVEDRYSPEVVIREGASPKIRAATEVTLTGTNLHSRMRVWAFDGGTILLPSGSMEEPPGPPTISGVHYHEVPIVGVAADGTSMRVRMDVPSNLGSMEFWVRDNWSRPERERFWHRAGGVGKTLPPYELTHGFEFDNRGDGHDIDDYRAAFPDLVCDPFKMVGFWAWFPIYLLALDGGGECVGMVSTSDQFSRWRTASTFDSDVFYANGFMASELMPAQFHTGNPCSPTPLNVWGQIRANHGVQFSAEYIGSLLSQLNFIGGAHTDMADQYARVRANPRGKIICFRPGLFDTGHAVLALATRDEGTNPDGSPNPDIREIIVYDPNHPETRRVMRLDIVANEFFYDGFSPAWEGNVLVSHSVREFWETRSRNLITLDSLGVLVDQFGARGLAELVAMLVSGEARPMVTLRPGQQVGRDAAGNRVETATNALSLPVWSYIPGTEPGPSQIFAEATGEPIQMDVHVEGESYAVNTMHMGSMFQLFVEGGSSGQVDRLDMEQEGKVVQGFRFTPEAERSQVIPRIALAQGGSNYVASLAWEGITVPGGAWIGVREVRDAEGAELDNETGVAIQPRIVVATPAEGGPATNQFWSVPIPSGATQRAVLAAADGSSLRTELDLDRDGTPELIAFSFAGEGGTGEGPVLEAVTAAGGLRLSWPAQGGTWALEQSADLVTWSPVGISPELEGGSAAVTVPFAGEEMFFRLRSW